MTFRAEDSQSIMFTRCPALPNAAHLAYQLDLVSDHDLAGAPLVQFIGADKAAQDARYWLRYAGYSKPLWAFAHGEDTRLIAISRHRSACPVYCASDSGITSIGDMKGRRVAVFRDAGLKLDYNRIIYLQTYAAALATAGMNLSDVEFIDFGMERASFMARAGVDYARLNDKAEGYFAPINLFTEIARLSVELLMAGKVDAFASNLPDGVERFLGLRKLYDPSTERDPDAGHDLRCLVVSGAALRERRDDLVEIVSGLIAAGDWADRNGTAATTKALARDLRVDPSVLMLDTGDLVAGMSADLAPDDVAMLERKKQFLLNNGLLDRDVDLAAWIDPTIVADACARLRAKKVAAAS